MEEIHTHPAMEKAKQIDSDHVIIDADTFLNVKKLVELSKIEFQDHTLTVEGLIRIIQKLQNENKQLRIAFGKYIAGYRPGDELWSKFDQEAFDIAKK